ncbi:LysR substrate-binding domain-containing protein [Dactylosporangium sp. NPDC005572]|uniref:LysR substrate-binding domain-containing protein n=1 Tax=Dactylosporangium sp. NPDC005572 TaxID=3156889 RepID=UPI0033AA4FBB
MGPSPSRDHPAELAAAPLVAREAESGTRRSLEAALRERGCGPIATPMLELSSTTAIKHAVAAGSDPAVLSSLAVTTELATATLAAVPVVGPPLRRCLRIVWPTGRQLTGPPPATCMPSRATPDSSGRSATALGRAQDGGGLAGGEATALVVSGGTMRGAWMT